MTTKARTADSAARRLQRPGSAVVVHDTLAAADVPDATLRGLAAEADDLWPQPWRDVIADCVRRRSVQSGQQFSRSFAGQFS
jgi:hypothetical protein